MRMAKERIYDSIPIKPTYIYIPLVLRAAFAFISFILIWVLSLLLYIFIAQYFHVEILSAAALPLSVLTALFPSYLILSVEQILKKLTKRWTYAKFRFVQRFARTLVFQIIVYLVIFLVANTFYGPLPSWTGFLMLGTLLIMVAAGLLADFYTYNAEAVLCFRTFLVELDKKADDTNFLKLMRGAKIVAELAKYYNMEISPYSLSLGMTVSFLEDREQAKEDLKDLIDWIESSTNTGNFGKFRKLTRKYNSIAEESLKDGIKEKHHWTFESYISLSSAIVVPFAIAVIAVVVPKLLEMFWKG